MNAFTEHVHNTRSAGIKGSGVALRPGLRSRIAAQFASSGGPPTVNRARLSDAPGLERHLLDSS
jgi:hypothetical protein